MHVVVLVETRLNLTEPFSQMKQQMPMVNWYRVRARLWHFVMEF